MGGVDLHLHTTASDGIHSPQQIVEMAAKRELKYIAITDHDTLGGMPEALSAATAYNGLTIIPGVEISTDYPGGLTHILGYFINYNDAELHEGLRQMRQSRSLRAQGMVERLNKLGIAVKWERVKQIAGDASIGRPHIAQALIEEGFIKSREEAFIRYIGQGGPAYVERIKKSPEDAVKMILDSGGLPVLAHPLTLDEPEKMIARLKKAGLTGVEAHYGEFSNEQVSNLLKLADKYKLFATGGSDYHGFGYDYEVKPGENDVPLSCALQMIELHKTTSD
jgi:predicted metal-dependent phosphoesterase TrpH